MQPLVDSLDQLSPPAQRSPVISLTSVSKSFGHWDRAVQVVRNVSLEVVRSSFVAVMGPSGSGKSTLLHCAAGLDRATSGSLRLNGTELSALKESALARLRRSDVGFVFQAYNLIPSLTVRQNVALPLRLAGRRGNRAWVDELIGEVGLSAWARRRPAQLSGGQQQRVAVARALVTQPAVIFADEPTGALDSRSSRDVLGLLRRAVDLRQQTVVMVTHDPGAASVADRVVFMADGELAGQLESPSGPAQVAASLAALGA